MRCLTFAKTKTGEYIHNIEARDFRKFVSDSVQVKDLPNGDTKDDAGHVGVESGNRIKEELIPQSLALGPDDMFCWISKRTVHSNEAFDNTFPRLQRTLAQEKGRDEPTELVRNISRETISESF